MDRGPSKTNQHQLSSGNTGNRSAVRGLLSAKPWFLVPGPWAWARWFRNLGLVLKYLNEECFVIRLGYETARSVSSSFCLTVPAWVILTFLGQFPSSMVISVVLSKSLWGTQFLALKEQTLPFLLCLPAVSLILDLHAQA
jgi:hypothetical protein